MAQYYITIRTYLSDAEIGEDGRRPRRTTITTDIPQAGIAPGDSVRFTSYNTAYTVSGLSSAIWTVASNFTVPAGGSVTRTARNPASGSNIVTMAPSGYPSTSRNIIVQVQDTTPDPIPNLNLAGQNPSDKVRSLPFRVTGINTPTTVTIVGGWIWSWVNGQEVYNVTSKTVVNNEYLSFGMDTPTTFNTQKSVTITIGTWTGTWTVTTRDIGADISYIPVPYSGSTIKLSDVIATFSNPLSSPGNLRSYFRAPGGSFVPDLPVNAGVPKSGTIKLSNFIGARNALYWVKMPQSVSYSWNTIAQGSKTITAQWNMEGYGSGQAFSLGFGDYLNSYAEIRYVLSLGAGVTYSVDGGSPGTWSTRNRWITLSASGVAGREDRFSGTVTIYVRHPRFPAVILSKAFSASFFFFGV